MRLIRLCGQNIRLPLLGISMAIGCGVTSLHGAEEFRLFTRRLVIPERGTVTSYVLQTSQYRFSFLPPPGWTVKENPMTKEVVLMARNLAASIRIKIAETKPDKTEAWIVQRRKEIPVLYPGARTVAEFPCYTSSIEGIAFDLERIGANKTKMSTRLAFIPLAEGRIEFELTTASSKFEEYHFAFGNLLTSFRIQRAAVG